LETNKNTIYGKKKVKLCLFAENMITYLENPEESIQKKKQITKHYLLLVTFILSSIISKLTYTDRNLIKGYFQGKRPKGILCAVGHIQSIDKGACYVGVFICQN
jgi:hypothetical protein